MIGDGPTVLMWHGRGPREADALLAIADLVSGRGRRVVVPEWDASAPDRGRSRLLETLQWSRDSADHDPDQLVLAGWSLGGIAAASLCLRQADTGVGLARVVCIAAAPFPRIDPLTGSALGPATPPVGVDTTVGFVTGTRDELIDLDAARACIDQWSAVGWPVTATEVDADHWSILSDHAAVVAAAVIGT